MALCAGLFPFVPVPGIQEREETRHPLDHLSGILGGYVQPRVCLPEAHGGGDEIVSRAVLDILDVRRCSCQVDALIGEMWVL